jgi:hypothetical protein
MAFNSTFNLSSKKYHQFIFNFVQPVQSHKTKIITSYLYHAITNSKNIKQFYKLLIDLSDFNDNQNYITKIYLENYLHSSLGIQRDFNNHYKLLKLLKKFDISIDINIVENKNNFFLKLFIQDIKLFKNINVLIPYHLCTDPLEMDILFQSAKNTYEYDFIKELNKLTIDNFYINVLNFKKEINYQYIMQQKFLELNSDAFMKYLKLSMYEEHFDKYSYDSYDIKDKLYLLNKYYWDFLYYKK